MAESYPNECPRCDGNERNPFRLGMNCVGTVASDSYGQKGMCDVHLVTSVFPQHRSELLAQVLGL